jgi:integral membrane protein
MSSFIKTKKGRLRLIAFIEGTSFLIILFITMPLKYLLGLPEANYFFGMLHGIFFILYVAAVIQGKFTWNWTLRTTFLAFLASIIPFGTFWADSKIFSRMP